MKQYILCAFVFITFFGCKKDNPITAQGPTYIYPLEIGNLWNFTITDYDSLSNVISSYGHQAEIVKDTMIGNERWFQSDVCALPITNRNDGFYVTLRGAGSALIPELYLPFPATLGQLSQSAWSIKVISTDTIITANNKEYHCYGYVVKGISDEEYNNTLFVAPGIGPIQQESYVTLTSGRRFLYELSVLESYVLK